MSEEKEGLRYNEGKIDLTQLSPICEMLESLVFQYGACKYARDNYKFFKKDTSEMNGEERSILEFYQSFQRHIMYYKRGEWLDSESKLPHLAHAVWNLNRIMDIYYLGLTHKKEGKDLFQQPLRRDLPQIPTPENFESIYGFKPGSKKEITKQILKFS